MSRYAAHAQQILYSEDGKLKGFNAGYGFYAEHEYGYKGMEQLDKSRFKNNNKKKNPFTGEIVKNPEWVRLIQFEKGKNVFLTNDNFEYGIIQRMDEEDKEKYIEGFINNRDRACIEELCTKKGWNMETPEVIALWNDSRFYLISTNEQSKELLETLYSEIKKKNVAISSDYSFMFKDRGLSFVLLDQLTPEDLVNKQLVDHREEMGRKFEEEYNEFLEKEGLAGYGVEMNYPLRFANVQITGLNQTEKGISPEFYLELYHIDHGEWDNNSCLFNVTHRMSGDEIKFLVPIAKSKEFEEFANSHSKEEIEVYVNEQLENYHEQQRIAEEQGYEVGENSLDVIASEQRTETVEKTSLSLKDRISKWLHLDRENDKDKSEEKGE